ncbi:endolytic transglycosylase MltG [Rheinheimera muenzenbergensis]|uniref:Endolytic murein transglycosylase n=1 Tax=Rheinheimera muenzenbergensis TaxID=1193628 RepID=A0ABU8C9G5_9GAMM
MLKRLAGLLVAVVIAAAAGGGGWYSLQQAQLQLDSDLYPVAAGSSAGQLCHNWQQQGRLSSADCLLLRIYLKLNPAAAHVQQGLYRISNERTLLDVLALFRSGREAQFSLTFIEGETLAQAMQRLQSAEYLQLDISSEQQVLALLQWPAEWGSTPERAEALLYPDTYYYTANSPASNLIKRAQQALLNALDNAWQQRQGDLPLQNRYQLLTLASIIEKESSYPPEKTLVASVFVNRLRKNMRLQTDPTVIYGLQYFNGNITRADLNNPHPYNTYRHRGLPPGPIALTSAASLLAAAQPAQTDLYYFVSKGDGTHQFSSTLQQHNAAVKKYIFGEQ